MAADKVILRFSLTMSEPYNISISDPAMAESLELVATVKQESSPFPDRAVTILTTESILDNGTADAFWQRLMEPPTDVNDDSIKIHMHPLWCHGRRVRDRHKVEPLDMCQRRDFDFITVPPPGQGSVDVRWSFAPENLFRSYMLQDSVEDQLKRFTVGQQFKIGASWSRALWWAWGSLEHDLIDKKLSRWSLPTDLPITREAGQDGGDKVNHALIDIVDESELDDISREWDNSDSSDLDPEEPPKVKEMRADDWVFGEPPLSLELICDQYAYFKFVK